MATLAQDAASGKVRGIRSRDGEGAASNKSADGVFAAVLSFRGSAMPMPHRSLLRFSPFAVGLCLMTLAGSSALASGGGISRTDPASQAAPDPSSSSQNEEPDLTTCPKGQVWSVKRKACIRMRGDILPDDELADYAYALAKAGRYDEALAVLDTMHDPNTAEALNYRGYATRKLGRTDEGIGYYLRSVALAPRYAQVREYLGEAYLIKGRRDLATEQLETIETLCGTGCEPYRDLSAAIGKAPGL